ncbi:hypothetical protein L1987_83889 [Smallanthus sonchifolius]|uniref:Uncharacterized protein n=1 Tax=Smallanthus sonchifolius TaxID=185202 RepID=A0ACB8YD98_9ASTR|nr:hypothetical protein L1987_83889 [Smallanthus sonchifolius]
MYPEDPTELLKCTVIAEIRNIRAKSRDSGNQSANNHGFEVRPRPKHVTRFHEEDDDAKARFQSHICQTHTHKTPQPRASKP